MNLRGFGSLQYKPNKTNPTRILASFPTPVEAYSKWPDLPLRVSKSFKIDEQAEAKAWLRRQQLLIEAGSWEPETIVKQRQTVDRITFGEYFDQWFEQRRTKTGKPLSPQTKYRMSKDAHNHVLPFFGATRMVDIDQHMIEQWLDQLPAGQEAMKANALKLLLAVLRTASEPGEHGKPPIISSMPYTLAIKRVRKTRETVPATPDEVHMIYEAMPAQYQLSVYLAVFCRGLRIGEVCALQRKHIDLRTRMLHVRQSRMYMGESMVGGTKTESSVRDERIPDALIPIIEQHLAGLPDYDDAWIFPSVHDLNAPVHPNSMRTWFDKARKQAGRPDLRFHDLRHTALTWLAQDGATLKELMDSAGHTTTENALRYQHAAAERDVTLANSLGARLIDMTPESVRARIREIDTKISVLQEERARQERLLIQLEQE